MQKLILLALLTFSFTTAHSEKHTLCKGYAPENDMWIPDSPQAMGIEQAEFNEVLDRIQKEYEPEVARKGGSLMIQRLWSNGTVNASAQRFGRMWIISMYGGMARHPMITADGFAAVACHEMGHHLGGAPRYNNNRDWAAIEGQSDYYSVLKCLRRIFANDDNKSKMAGVEIDPTALSACSAQHATEQERWICVRSVTAGLVMGRVLANLKETAEPSLTTPDPSQVNRTFESHPQPQCRVDTLLQGSICPAPVGEELSEADYRPGSCHSTDQHSAGFRPRCWFAPN